MTSIMRKRNCDETEIVAGQGENKKSRSDVGSSEPIVQPAAGATTLSIPMLGEPLTAYEIQYAKENGASDDDIQDMQFEFYIRKKEEEQRKAESYNEDDGHDDACGCEHCQMMLFEGESDENNDGGVIALAEWKAQVAKARVEKALKTLHESEFRIRDYLKRTNEYRQKVAQEAAELEAVKLAYVHVEGTSKLLEYGKVPNGLKRRLLKIKGVKMVDTHTLENKQIRCCIFVEWPRPELNDSQREAHFRILLSYEGIKHVTSDDLMIIGVVSHSYDATQPSVC